MIVTIRTFKTKLSCFRTMPRKVNEMRIKIKKSLADVSRTSSKARFYVKAIA